MFRRGMWWALAALLIAAPRLRSQQTAEADLPSIILGTVAADKGTIASLPVYLNGGAAGLRQLSVSVDFISNSVKFYKLDTSASSSGADARIAVEVQALPPDPKGLPRTRLTLAAVTPQRLSDGLLAFLSFTLAADAKPFAVSLQPTESSAVDAQGRAVRPSVEAGKVIVSAEDEESIGCFFFTH